MKFVKQLSSIVNEFVEKNGKLIAGTIVFSVIAAIARDYGYLSPNYGFTNNGEFKFSMKPEPKEEKRDWTNDVNLMPPITNSFQEAVIALWRSGGNKSWESTKLDAATQIMKLIQNKKDITEEDMMYGIKAMSKISQKASWESTKESINGMISKLVATVTPVTEKEGQSDGSDR